MAGTSSILNMYTILEKLHFVENLRGIDTLGMEETLIIDFVSLVSRCGPWKERICSSAGSSSLVKLTFFQRGLVHKTAEGSHKSYPQFVRMADIPLSVCIALNSNIHLRGIL